MTQCPFAPSETIRFCRIEQDGTALYTINESPARAITFSHLNGLFIKNSSTSLYCCSVSSQDTSYQLFRLQEEEFWKIVQGKSFLVITDYSTLRIDDRYLSKGGSLVQSVDELFSQIEKGRKEGEGLIHSAPCYQFIEVPPLQSLIR